MGKKKFKLIEQTSRRLKTNIKAFVIYANVTPYEEKEYIFYIIYPNSIANNKKELKKYRKNILKQFAETYFDKNGKFQKDNPNIQSLSYRTKYGIPLHNMDNLTRDDERELEVKIKGLIKELSDNSELPLIKAAIQNNMTVKFTNNLRQLGCCIKNSNATYTLEFSYQLLSLPENYIKAVVAHELAHIYYMNHSRMFYSVCRKILPEYEEYIKERRDTDGYYIKITKGSIINPNPIDVQLVRFKNNNGKGKNGKGKLVIVK